jgi:hypothetical protein
MKLTPNQLRDNWKTLIQLIKDTFEEDSERRNNLLNMYHHFEDRMMFTPASGIVYYHNAFPGGYVLHILNVTRFALKLHDLYNEIGMHTSEYTKENIVFSALHHDLGKIGDMTNDYYIPNESEWHRKNQGKIYEYNKNIHYMGVTDRTFWLLSQFNIKLNELEFLSIKLADGLYEDGSRTYLMGFGEDKNLKTNLPQLIHTADMLATRWEKEQYMFNTESDINYAEVLDPSLNDARVTQEQKSVENIKKATMKETSEDLSQKSKDLFNELFGEEK